MSAAVALPSAEPAQTVRTASRSLPMVESSPLAGLDRGTIEAWRQLVMDDPQSSLPLLPEVISTPDETTVLTAWEGRGGNRRLVGVAVLVNQQFDLSHHLLPIGPTRHAGLRLVGNRILCGDHPTVLSALVHALAEELIAASAGLLEIEDVAVESPFTHALEELAGAGFRCPAPIPPQPHHRIRLPLCAEEYWSRQFSSKERSELRRRRKKLGEDVRVERYRQAQQVDEFLRHAGAVAAQSWQSRRRGINVVGTEAERQGLEVAASLDAWRSYVLFRESQPIAFALGYQWRDTYLYDQVGYDSRCVGLAPGKMLLVEILNDLFREDRPAVFDFGPGHLEYKADFSNETTLTATRWLLPPGVRSLWLERSLSYRQTLSAQVRRALKYTGLKNTAHRIHRRGWRALGRWPSPQTVHPGQHDHAGRQQDE